MPLVHPTRPQGREEMLEILRTGTDRYGQPFDLEKFNAYGRKYGKTFDDLVTEGERKEVVLRKLDTGEVITHRHSTKILFVSPAKNRCYFERLRIIFPSGKVVMAKPPQKLPGVPHYWQLWTVRETRFRDETAIDCAFRGTLQEARPFFEKHGLAITKEHFHPMLGRWNELPEIRDSSVFYNMRSSVATDWFELRHDDFPCDEPDVLIDVPESDDGTPLYEQRTEILIEPRVYIPYQEFR